MHELGIAQDFWAVIEQHAKSNNLKRVTKITIVLGEASGIEADFLRHSMVDHVLPGTIAEGAELEIVTRKLSALCTGCGAGIGTEAMKGLCCPSCGSPALDVKSGKETYVESIEGE